MTMKCFFDVDGVIADFVGGACRAHGCPNPYLDGVPSAAGEYRVEKLLGMTAEEFWRPLGNRTFWQELPVLVDGCAILAYVERMFQPANVCLLTSPSLSPEAAAGKMAWIQDRFPEYGRRFLIGPPKEFCAHENSVLIDDSDENVRLFAEHGGGVVLVPRPWNQHHGLAAEGETVKFVRFLLNELEICEVT